MRHPADLVNGKHRVASIERVSMTNAKFEAPWDAVDTWPVSQNALIKFVRNTSSTLRWFRSDLTTDNVEMLQKEFPEIEFLN